MSNDLKLIANDFNHSQALFDAQKLVLQQLLQGFDVLIEHFGSTAIPGTIGKGIIDILVSVNEEDQLKIKDLLISSGYRRGELNKKPDGRLFFCNVMGQSQAGDIHLHLVIKNSENRLQVIRFRDYLLSHPKEIELYNQEKRRLAKTTGYNRHEYTSQKAGFIRKLIGKA